MISNKWIYLLLVLLLSNYISIAQVHPLPCGGYVINKQAVERMRQRRAAQRPLTAGNHYVIKVFMFICRYNDGSNAGATLADVQNEFARLQTDYLPGNICFVYEGTSYINNTKLDTVNIDQAGSSQLFAPYLLPDCINIFYTKTIGGSNAACAGGCGYGGYTFTAPGNFCIVANGNLGAGQTTSHEVGHCLGLFHTFDHAYGYEDIDGSNSSTSGDQVTDTPADPYGYIGQGCFTTSANGCLYTGNCPDSNGSSSFTPPYSNLMAYWWGGGCYANLAVTAQQFYRTHYFLETSQLLINTRLYTTQDVLALGANLNNVLGPGLQLSSGTQTFAAQYQLTVSGAGNTISGSAKVTMVAGSLILLEPGLRVTPAAADTVLFTIARACNN